MRKIVLILVLICVIIVLPYEGEAKSLEDVLVKRASFLSKLQTRWDDDLNSSDQPTEQQIINRVNSIIKYAKKYNYFTPEIFWEDVAIDVYAIITTETGFINYSGLNGDKPLDNGHSFGTGSMQWNTTKELAEEISIPFSKWLLQQRTDLQIELVVYNYYKKYHHFGNRRLAIVSYNQGYSISTKTQRYEKYFFQVNGRVHYIKNNLL